MFTHEPWPAFFGVQGTRWRGRFLWFSGTLRTQHLEPSSWCWHDRFRYIKRSLVWHHTHTHSLFSFPHLCWEILLGTTSSLGTCRCMSLWDCMGVVLTSQYKLRLNFYAKVPAWILRSGLEFHIHIFHICYVSYDSYVLYVSYVLSSMSYSKGGCL